MIRKLREKLSNELAYVQVWQDRLSVINIQTGHEFDEPALLALEAVGKTKAVVAIGKDAQQLVASDSLEICRPFAHPRCLISDFYRAEALLKAALRSVFPFKVFRPLPKVVIHPMENMEGGLTNIEARALLECGLGAGAMEVVVYVGEPLDLHNFNFNDIKLLGVTQ